MTKRSGKQPTNDIGDNRFDLYRLIAFLAFLILLSIFGCSPRTVPVKVVYNDLEVDTLYLKKGEYVMVKENGEFTLIYKNKIEADGIIYFEQIR